MTKIMEMTISGLAFVNLRKSSHETYQIKRLNNTLPVNLIAKKQYGERAKK